MTTNTVKSTFDLEPNPFEQSFAPNKQGQQAGQQMGQQMSQQKPVIQSPSVLTPGGSRRLPPLVLSPNMQALGAVGVGVAAGTGSTAPAGANSGAGAAAGATASGTLAWQPFQRTGLTPNIESNMRTGLTPNNLSLPGLNTPGLIANFTPGLSSLLNNSFDQLGSSAGGAGAAAGTATGATTGASTAAATAATSTASSSGMIDISLPASANIATADTSHQPTPPGSASKDTAGAPAAGDIKIKLEKQDKLNKKKEKAQERERKKVLKKQKKERDSEDLERRKDFLERNRLAASKCRQRKKQQYEKLQNDLDFYLNKHNLLTNSIIKIKDHLLYLQNYSLKLNDKNLINSIQQIMEVLDASLSGGDNNSMHLNQPSTIQVMNPNL